MGISGGPDMIQDGLVLSLDASDRNSYVSGSTTWVDVSGNGNNGTLTNGPTFDSGSGGSIVFDGTNDHCLRASSISMPQAGNITIICWCWPDSTGPSNDYTGLFSVGGRSDATPSNSTLLNLKTNQTTWTVGSAYWYNDFNPGDTTVSVRKNEWNMVGMIARAAATVDNTTLFKNNADGFGILTGSSSAYTKGVNRTLTNLTIGCSDTGGGRPMKGRIASVMVYNRELTQSEILQNYNSQKSRFNL
jgi:hypothetical protein